jgi:hypothetical protein
MPGPYKFNYTWRRVQVMKLLIKQFFPVYVPPFMSETKFHTHTEQQAKLYILIFISADSRREDKRFCTE